METKINSQNNLPEGEEKTSKFNQFENAIISGEYTGLGDMEVVIYEVEFSQIDESFYYVVSSFSHRFYCNERFLSDSQLKK